MLCFWLSLGRVPDSIRIRGLFHFLARSLQITEAKVYTLNIGEEVAQ